MGHIVYFHPNPHGWRMKIAFFDNGFFQPEVVELVMVLKP
jgi:hypothetical protein